MSIYKRKSGRWAVLIDVERQSDGKRVRRAIGTFRTRKDAAGAERKALEARELGIDLSPKTVTVAELLDRYLADREALNRGAEKRLQEYRGCADRLVCRILAGLRLPSSGRLRVAEWTAKLLKCGGEEWDEPTLAQRVYITRLPS